MDREQLQKQINIALEEAKKILILGEVADYIPELARSDSRKLGIKIKTTAGECLSAGDIDNSFSMQSISKVCAFIMACINFSPARIFTKVGMEPSGAPFSELTTLGDFSEKPYNPFINAGALVVSSMLDKHFTIEEVLQTFAQFCGTSSLDIDQSVYESESENNYKNHAIAWELKRLNLLSTDPDSTLDFYTKLCSIEVNLDELSNFALLLANNGRVLKTGESLIPEDIVLTTLSLMFTCGLYDGTGRFAVHTGLPAKSGVSGGIIAVKPGEFGIATYGPALDRNGNSIGGIRLISQLSNEFNWHVFKH